MGTSFNGLTPSATYTGLLKFGDNAALSASLKAISDGAGNDTILELSTTALQIGGSTGAFWDNTNKRLGIGTNNAYAATLQVKGVGTSVGTNAIFVENSAGLPALIVRNNGTLDLPGNLFAEADVTIGNATTSLSARLGIKGSGSTSATTSLLVQNSGGSEALKVRDDRVIIMAGLPTSASGLPTGALWNNLGILNIA